LRWTTDGLFCGRSRLRLAQNDARATAPALRVAAHLRPNQRLRRPCGDGKLRGVTDQHRRRQRHECVDHERWPGRGQPQRDRAVTDVAQHKVHALHAAIPRSVSSAGGVHGHGASRAAIDGRTAKPMGPRPSSRESARPNTLYWKAAGKRGGPTAACWHCRCDSHALGPRQAHARRPLGARCCCSRLGRHHSCSRQPHRCTAAAAEDAVRSSLPPKRRECTQRRPTRPRGLGRRSRLSG
jgi:hypothetical protein